MHSMIPFDYHMHSLFSADAKYSIQAMCESAIQKGIPEIGLTEHFNLHLIERPVFYQPERWWKEIECVRKSFEGQLIVRAGIEIGEPHRFPDEVRTLLNRFPYDYAIGSLHYVGDNFVFDNRLLRRAGADAFMRPYFRELGEMTREPQFDVLGHLDVPVRNGKPIWGSYDPGRYEELIRVVLQNCIRHGIALDVNSGGFRRPAKNLMPDLRVLQWYREMGGERLTLGSDAHTPAEVGLYLDQALKGIQESGFKYLTQYIKRQPLLLPLP
jgi:histidinol-phosphatase (PHP family)